MIDSTALYETVLETVPDACIVYDRDLRVLYANLRARERAGLSREDIFGRRHAELWPESGEGAEDWLHQVLANDEPVRTEIFFPRYGGWIEITATPIPAGISVFYRGIADRKQAEEALSLTQERYREMMRQSPLSIQILTPEGNTRWVNDSFTRLWGATVDDLEGFNLLKDPQMEELGLLEPLSRAFAGEFVVLPRRRYDATRVQDYMGVRVVRAMAYPVRDAAGAVVEVVLIHEDVTEIATSEERLAQQERQLQTVMEAIGAGRWEIDLGSGRLQWSNELFQLFNIPPDEEPCLDKFVAMTHPADRDMAQRALQRAIATIGLINIEFRVQVPERGERWFASVGRVLAGEDGQAERVVGINFDVTDRVTTEAALARTELSLALAMKGGRMGYWTRSLATDEQQRDDPVEWSPELEQVFGLPPGGFKGTVGGFFALMHPDDRQTMAEAVESAVREGTDYSVQFRFRHTDGSWHWMEGRGRATLDEKGRAVRLDGLGIDITAQKRAEEERREAEARFRRLADSLPAVVWSTDAEGNILYLNDEWGRFTGIDLVEYRRQGALSVIQEEDIPRVLVAWAEARRAGVEFRVEARFRRYDGVYRWFLASVVPTRNEQGTIVGWFGTATDIHDQKRTEQTLRLFDQLAEATRNEDDPKVIIRKTEHLLRHYLAASRCAYAEIEEDNEHFTLEMDDCEGCDSIVGRYPLSAFGQRAAQELRAGRPFVVCDIDAEAERVDDLAAYRLTQIRAIVCVSLVKEGRMVASMSVHQTEPRDWTEEEVALVQMVADRCWSDIARARANRRIVASETQYRQVAETLPQLVWSTQPDGHHDYFNSRWYEYVGTPVGQTHGNGWEAIIHSEDLARTMAAWQNSLETGVPYQIECRLRRQDGTYNWFLGRALPIRDAEDRIVRWFGTCTDIQLQKEAAADLEARVRARTSELEAANRELEGFTYTVSHDLRAPLRAIMATSMILLEEAGDKLEGEEKVLLSRQAHNARRLGSLIDDLLHMSRLGRQELTFLPVDLAALAHDVVAELRADGTGIDTHFEIPDSLPVRGDANLLRFLLLNLIENAVKFSPAGSTVTLAKSENRGFYVRDQGIGFDPRYAHKLFLPFERLVSDSEYPGTGIGLANVQRIVERHGGTVTAESLPGQGATFYFTLPD